MRSAAGAPGCLGSVDPVTSATAVTAPPPSPAVTRRFDVGIAGAGQLARMTCLAAWPLGLRVAVLGRPDEPAGPMAAGVVEGDWKDAAAVRALGAAAVVVTLENEFVDARALEAVEAAGTPVRPGAEALARVQDKAAQKALLREAGLPVAPSVVVRDRGELEAAGRDLGWPLMLKARRLGYDGYGNATCADPQQGAAALARLDAGEGVLAEAWVPFARELAAMVARSPSGDEVVYPVVQTVQRDGVCREVLAPAPIAEDHALDAQRIALQIAAELGVVGVFAVELFDTDSGVLVNELAMRPHNSGHWTIDGAVTSQFEQHLRAVLDLPLGSTAMRDRHAVMANVLGGAPSTSLRVDAEALSDLGRAYLHCMARDPGLRIHNYGKKVVPGRKVGHVTVSGDDPADLLERARHAAGFMAGDADAIADAAED